MNKYLNKDKCEMERDINVENNWFFVLQQY